MSRSQYPGQSPNLLPKKDELKLRQKEVRVKYGSPKHLLSSYLTVKCPDCFCILKAKSAGNKKEWLTQCKNHHCWIVNLEKGIDHPILEKIPFHDPAYPGRAIKG